jgi:hypothetical protein
VLVLGELPELRELQAEGVVGQVGVASNNPSDNAPFVETGEFAIAVVPVSVVLPMPRATAPRPRRPAPRTWRDRRRRRRGRLGIGAERRALRAPARVRLDR